MATHQHKLQTDPHDRNVPLCVDLDGTLVKTDLLVESALTLLKRNILFVVLFPLWLLKGKANLKHQIAMRVDLDVELLPFNAALLAHLREQKSDGRFLVLATATNVKLAKNVANHLGLFDDVLASDANTNVAAATKSRLLRERFNDHGYDYIGNSRADLEVWEHARTAIVVNPDPGIGAAAARVASGGRIASEDSPGMAGYIRALRPHQWLKNLLVFVPLIGAHELSNPTLLFQGLLAFVAFGLCASSGYLVNDLFDLSADRHHPRKARRPFAAGSISIKHGLLLVPVVLLASAGIASALPLEFFVVLIGYFLLSLGYSVWLKEKVILDVLLLAGLYTLRVIAGAAATSIVPSFWLLAFSMFLFLSLALLKRYAELLETQDDGEQAIRGRSYRVADQAILSSMGTASGYLSVLVLALYINSDKVKAMYSYPEAFWLLCPLVLYWISRIWVVAARGGIRDDPLIFAIKDRVSRWVVILSLAILLLAS